MASRGPVGWSVGVGIGVGGFEAGAPARLRLRLNWAAKGYSMSDVRYYRRLGAAHMLEKKSEGNQNE